MKKAMKKFLSVLLVMILCMGGLSMSTQSMKVEAAVVSRDDGTWLFPLAKGYYNSFTDWAGCPGYSTCIFCGTTHNSWGDSDHTGQSCGHNGIDIGVPNGTDVLATASGYVYYMNTNWSARGYTVVMEHAIGNGWSYYSIYQHLSKCNVVVSGSYVKAGTVIAKSGNTGGSYTYGNHLHFGIVMGKSGLGASVADMGTGTLNSLERPGWITTSGYREGRILNNPASSNDAGFPSGNSAVVPPLKAHYGSVHYTFDANKVTLGSNNQPSQPTLSTPICDGTQTTFQWNACDKATSYNLVIYREGGEQFAAYNGITQIQYSIPATELYDGTFLAQVTAMNSSGSTAGQRVPVIIRNTVRIFLEDVNVFNIDTGLKEVGKERKIPIDNVNGGRGENQIVLFTSEYITKTNTNQWGMELAVDRNGQIVAKREYLDTNGLAIPEGGFVISLYSQSEYCNTAHVGEYAAFNRSTNQVHIYSSQEEYNALTRTIAKNQPIGQLPESYRKWHKPNYWAVKSDSIAVHVDSNSTIYAEDTIITQVWGLHYGDSDGNSFIELADAQVALKAALKIENLSEQAISVSDLDGNNSVDLSDAQKILKVALKIETL